MWDTVPPPYQLCVKKTFLTARPMGNPSNADAAICPWYIPCHLTKCHHSVFYFCVLPLKPQLPTLILEPVGQKTHCLPKSDVGRAKVSPEQAVRNLPSDFPALQSHIVTCHPFHSAQMTVQAQETKPAGISNPSNRQSYFGISFPETSGSLMASAELTGTARRRTANKLPGWEHSAFSLMGCWNWKCIIIFHPLVIPSP